MLLLQLFFPYLKVDNWSNVIVSVGLLHLMESGVSYNYRLVAAFVLPAVCAYFVATVVRNLRPGWPRIFACVPVFAFNFCSPALFDEKTQLISKLILMLCFVWLSNFKVFALCLDRGALSRKALTPLQFYALYVAPITPQDEIGGGSTTISCASHVLCNFVALQSCTLLPCTKL